MDVGMNGLAFGKTGDHTRGADEPAALARRVTP
jgi:hypothetical protein